MQFAFEGATNINIGDFFIIIFPKFDTGFFPSDKGVGMEIIQAGVRYIQKTIVYPSINWLLIEIVSAPVSNTFSAGTMVGKIINLVYPRYSSIFGTLYVIRIPPTATRTFTDIVGVTLQGPYTLPVQNLFSSVKILVPYKAALYPGSQFEFQFIPQNDLLDGFTIQITFDSNFSL